ncbi:uncharacterized short-chain type dehydrogenase/reductase y4vI-like [Amphiura filiformis]|uniref:uncharacterized short-chain type dehydrogenase/reductase y4vI-like n=1 Tax=Amphiura filiformis TaxID=82378 RepID=UPI003B228D62
MSAVTFSFAGKVALVTGASSGIGAETARQFAASGCWLSLQGRDEERLKKVGEECQQKGMPKDKVLLIVADLTKDEDVHRVAQTTIDHFGRLDILVNNAGRGKPGDILHTEIQDYDYLVQLNVRAVVLLSNLCVSHLIKTKGNIVNVSSIAATRPMNNMVAYSMTKAAIDQFTRVSALDLASKQVRVNAVNPGSIMTPMHERSGRSLSEVLEIAKKLHPLGRIGEPIEVAKAILFLASDAASFTTGEMLDVSGGRLCSCPRQLKPHSIRVDHLQIYAMASVTFSFQGKIALVTGASSGIGAETARQLAASGCWISLVGRDEERLTNVGEECQQRGLQKEEVLLIRADLKNEADIHRVVHTTIDHFGRLDILVNNAGIFKGGDILNSTIEQFDELFQINVRAVVLLTNLCVPYLTKTKGSIVNVSSSYGTRPGSKACLHSMTKHAIDQFTRVSALELASKQVRVNAVNPGSILTPIHEKLGRSLPHVLEVSKKIHPLGRIGEASEVAKAILFLASDAASFTTGEMLNVSGGKQCMCPR